MSGSLQPGDVKVWATHHACCWGYKDLRDPQYVDTDKEFF
jgi:hypothetical protein